MRDANNPLSDSDDEGESMDWWSKYFASLDKMISVGFLVFVTRKIFKMLKLFRYFNFLFRVHQKILFYLKYQFMIFKMVLAAKPVSRISL